MDADVAEQRKPDVLLLRLLRLLRPLLMLPLMLIAFGFILFLEEAGWEGGVYVVSMSTLCSAQPFDEQCASNSQI